jgi:hypothetical protein
VQKNPTRTRRPTPGSPEARDARARRPGAKNDIGIVGRMEEDAAL